jgi:uncharacterized membrane protein YcaP (DUF421 family)
MWTTLWTPEIAILEKMFRPFVVYGFLLVGLRLAGKRELAQLNAMDLIVLLTLSNTVQNAIIGPDNSLTGGLIGATTLLMVNYVVVRFLFGHPGFDRLVEGRPTPLLVHGKLLHKNMQQELITRNELEVAAHRQGFAKLSQLEKAVLEPSGVISFEGKEPPLGEVRHGELTARLDEISRQLAEVRAAVAGGNQR